jgi:tetratricopeptide (TPR) repeat protein
MRGASSDTSPASAGEYRKALDLLTRAVAIDKAYRAAYDAKVSAAKKRNPAVPDAPPADSDLYQFLAAGYARTGDAAGALRATRKALALLPQTPDAYRQISYMFAQYKREDDAAVALIDGRIVTSDAALDNDLLDLYESEAFARTCAIRREAGNRAINHNCLRVQEHFCGASADVARVRAAAGRPDLARQQKERGAREYGCPA